MNIFREIKKFVNGVQALARIQSIGRLNVGELYLVNIKDRMVSHEEIQHLTRALNCLNIKGVVSEGNMTFEPLEEAARYIVYTDEMISERTAKNIELTLKERGVTALVLEKGMRLEAQPFSFADYHNAAEVTVDYPEYGNNLVYPALGAAEEAGELAGKVKKLWRNCKVFSGHDIELGGEEATRLRQGAMKEVGDTLWYLDAACTELQTTLEECARLNVTKLLGRKERGTINGEGDDR